MKERAVERLVETYLLSDLEEAKEALFKGEDAKFSLPGETPGEKVAYIAAAIWIVEKIKLDKCEFKVAYDAYQQEIKEK
jgi:hypothetical protein